MTVTMTIEEAYSGVCTLLMNLTTPMPIEDYHEDMGPVLWWWWVPANYQGDGPARWAGEPPYIGTPLDLGFTVEAHTTTRIISQADQEHDPEPKIERIHVGGWPGYHTHWTPLPQVKQP